MAPVPATAGSGYPGVSGSDLVSAAPVARSLAIVEVRKNAEATTWYEAVLRDITGSKAVLSFADGVWPDREVPCNSVRPPPLPETIGLPVQYQPDDIVEFRVAASVRNPPGWALGRVQSIDRGLLQIAVDSTMRGASGGGIYSVAPDTIRPLNKETTLDPLAFKRQVVWIEPVLHHWLVTPDARGCIESVQAVAGLALAGPGYAAKGVGYTGDGGSAEAPDFDSVILIGSERACRKGDMLLRVHMMHQKEVEAFHDRRRQKLKVLTEKRKVPEHLAQVTFEVGTDLIGRTVGKGAERSCRIESQFDVEVRVVDAVDGQSPCIVRILGASQAVVNDAREELELAVYLYAVEEEMVGWVLGKGHSQIQEISQKTGLSYARWTGTALELCGRQQGIEDATMMLDSHKEYFHVYQEMNKQTEEIERSFELLNVAAENAGLGPRRPRPKSKGPTQSAGGGAAKRSGSRPRSQAGGQVKEKKPDE